MTKSLIAALFIVSGLQAAEVNLAWDANTEPDIAFYNIRTGIQPGTVAQSVNVGNVTIYTVPGLDYGTTYYFTATAVNTAGLESGPSNEVAYTPIAPVDDQVRYWPRLGANGRMNGGSFEAAQSKDGPWTKLGWSKWWPSYSGETITLPAGTLAQYKAFRYLGPYWKQGTVAEVEFIDNGAKITGAVFGTPGSWGNYGNTVEKAFDGNITTYWDSPGWAPENHAGIERQ